MPRRARFVHLLGRGGSQFQERDIARWLVRKRARQLRRPTPVPHGCAIRGEQRHGLLRGTLLLETPRTCIAACVPASLGPRGRSASQAPGDPSYIAGRKVALSYRHGRAGGTARDLDLGLQLLRERLDDAGAEAEFLCPEGHCRLQVRQSRCPRSKASISSDEIVTDGIWLARVSEERMRA